MTRKPIVLRLFTAARDGQTHWLEPGDNRARALRYLCGDWVQRNDELVSLVAAEDAPIEPDTCVDCVRWADELWPVTVR